MWLNCCVVGNGNKKSVGVVSSALIPTVRPSHCPQVKDKQRKPAHAKRIYMNEQHAVPHSIGGETRVFQGYNPLRWRSPLHYLCIWLSLRSLTTQTVTLENAFSRPALQMAFWPHSSICFFVGRIPQEGGLYTSSVAKLQLFSETNKKKA